MKFILNKDVLTIENNKRYNSGSIKYYEAEVEFDDTWSDLTIEAVLIKKGEEVGISRSIIDNKIYIDKNENGRYYVGFVGYTIENNEKTYQISTNLQEIRLRQGAGEIQTENEDIPTPTEWEIYIAQIQAIIDSIGSDTNYNALINKPSINNVELTGNKSLHELGIQREGNYVEVETGKGLSTNDFTDTYKDNVESNTSARHTHSNKNVLDGISSTDVNNWNNKAETSDIPDVSNFIDKNVNNLVNYTLKTNTGSLIDLEINQTTYVVTLSLKDQDGNVISTDTIDLPLENVVVSGSYDSTNQKIVLTLQSGDTVDIPVGALVSGLQSEITSQNKLASDLVDDSNSGNKFVTTSEKQIWNNKYDKPSGGIPKIDLANAVQSSLDKADTSIQDVSGKEDKTNKVTSLSSSSTDTQYPSAKCVYDIIGDVETILTTLTTGSGV